MTSVVMESNRNMNGEKLLICIKQCIMEHFQPMIYVENRNVIQTTRGTFSVPDNYRNHKFLAFTFIGHILYTEDTPVIEKEWDWPDPALVFNTVVDRITNHPELAQFISVSFISTLKATIGQGLDMNVKGTLNHKEKGIRRPKTVSFRYMESPLVNKKVTKFFSYLRNYNKIAPEYGNNTKFTLKFSCQAYWASGPNFAALKNVIRCFIVHEYISEYVERERTKYHIKKQGSWAEEDHPRDLSKAQYEGNGLTEKSPNTDEELGTKIDSLCEQWQSEAEDQADAEILAKKIVGNSQRMANLKNSSHKVQKYPISYTEGTNSVSGNRKDLSW
ncbi:Rep1p [Saccharomyces cerevisiae x Saccharomyces kudriavzevii VIN7]|uniref:Rep1p n=1 Tax=Saccharomyces cerevisiae x Saccharomyces kudriavzevii (strain VIN7) TaxID=1095631 RepID=H0H002_SACCK|nr:Rep1p [Saccharomyces cerevisiae x Saccharomyces kudriavzevii VIN7]